MKKVRIVLIATLLTFAAVSISIADGVTGKPAMKQAVSISYANAVENHGLLVAMNQQLSITILAFYIGPTLTADVKYQEIRYRITGTLEEWLEFFHQPGGARADTSQKDL